jgi:hypothetical protein
LGAFLLAPHAHAQDAGRLFDEGLKAFLAGKPAEGCPKIEASYAAEPLHGVLFTLAECQVAWGKLQTAYLSYQRFLDETGTLPPAERSKHGERRTVAESKSRALALRVPRLSVGVKGDLPSSARVLLDGKDVTDALGTPFAVDPGRHVIQLVVGDEVVAEKRVALAEAARGSVELALPEAGSESAPPAPADPLQTSTAGPRAGVYVLAGVGVAGIAVGSITGLMTLSKKSKIEDNCPNRTCNAEGRDAVDSAQSLGLISTIGFGVGAAALAGAAVLHFTSNSGSEHRASGLTLGVSPGGGGVGYRGMF